MRRVAVSETVAPTTKPSDGGIDAFVHHHDIALAVGRDVPTDDARLRGLPTASLRRLASSDVPNGYVTCG